MAIQLLKLDLGFSLNGQTGLNVFYYEMDNAENATDETLIDIGLQFDLAVIAAMAGALNDEWFVNELTMSTLLEDIVGAPPLSYIYEPAIINGDSGQEGMPSHDALSYKLTHNNPEIRQGAKRFSGFGEGRQVDGMIDIGAANYAELLTLENALSSGLQAQFGLPDETNLVPVVVKRIPYLAPDPTPVPGGTVGASYRLPTTLSEYVAGYVDDAILNPFIRTQNSRKQQ